MDPDVSLEKPKMVLNCDWHIAGTNLTGVRIEQSLVF